MKNLWKMGLAMVALVALAGTAVGIVAAQSAEDGTATPAATGEATSVPDATEPDATATPDGKDATAVPGGTDDGTAEDDERICGFGHLGANLDELAAFLQLSVDDLRAAKMDGQSLAQIAEAQGVSRDDLSAFLVEQVQAKLAGKVATGDIDQAQADVRLQEFTARVDDLIDRTGPPGGHHRFDGMPEATEESAETTSLTF